METRNHLVICRCATGRVGSESVRQEVLNSLSARGIPCSVVDDLCGLAASRRPVIRELAAGGGWLTVVACHPRAVRWVLSAAGFPVESGRLRVLDLRTLSAEEILAGIQGEVLAAPVVNDGGDVWTPWFPVIDYSRCTQCRQCLSFCLFGVYALSVEGKVEVAKPRSCKNNCPACARICPQVAIMFPKLPEAEAPLNGAEISDETTEKARARVSVKELLGSDLYAGLAQRRSEAKKRLLKTAEERAAAERAACVACSVCSKGRQDGETHPPLLS